MLQVASAAESPSLLDTHGRIEWEAGGLYAATLPDGTQVRLALPYPEPAGLPEGGEKVMESGYWMPARYTGQVQPFTPEQQLALSFDADRRSGKAEWTPPQGKRVTLSLTRLLPYRAVAFTRPSSEAKAAGSDQQFVFSALYPVIGAPAVDEWVRTMAGRCSADLSCTNRVTVRWHSPGQLSLDAGSWSYNAGAAHENYGSEMRHYVLGEGAPVHTRFTAYVAPSAACRDKVSGLLIVKLEDQGLAWARDGALDELQEPKFIPVASGIEFHWDPYQVGSFAQGTPSVFLTRAELGECATHLPSPARGPQHR